MTTTMRVSSPRPWEIEGLRQGNNYFRPGSSRPRHWSPSHAQAQPTRRKASYSTVRPVTQATRQIPRTISCLIQENSEPRPNEGFHYATFVHRKWICDEDCPVRSILLLHKGVQRRQERKTRPPLPILCVLSCTCTMNIFWEGSNASALPWPG